MESNSTVPVFKKEGSESANDAIREIYAWHQPALDPVIFAGYHHYYQQAGLPIKNR